MYETSWTNLDNGQTVAICGDGNTARASERVERDEENKTEESDNDGKEGRILVHK